MDVIEPDLCFSRSTSHQHRHPAYALLDMVSLRSLAAPQVAP